jgi:hypothetical protein
VALQGARGGKATCTPAVATPSDEGPLFELDKRCPSSAMHYGCPFALAPIGKSGFVLDSKLFSRYNHSKENTKQLQMEQHVAKLWSNICLIKLHINNITVSHKDDEKQKNYDIIYKQ